MAVTRFVHARRRNTGAGLGSQVPLQARYRPQPIAQTDEGGMATQQFAAAETLQTGFQLYRQGVTALRRNQPCGCQGYPET